MKTDQIFVINLSRNNKEIVGKINSLVKKGLTPVSYFILNAVNGWDVVEGKQQPPFDYKVADWWYDESAKNRWYNREMTPGEIGCALSHYDAIKIAYEDGHNSILVLEEDFKPSLNLPRRSVFDNLPDDWSWVYLGRNKVNDDAKEKQISPDMYEASYSYNCHAYVISRKGMKEILDSPYLDNLIPYDELQGALSGTIGREDAKDVFYNPEFKVYALDKSYIEQSSKSSVDSLTEFTPEYVKEQRLSKLQILNDSNWEEWSNKYICPQIIRKEYKLIIDEPGPNIYTFPFFTKAFCKELIELSEQFDWTTDRHTFYPTTDNLLEVLGMDKIWNRLINDYIKPLAVWAYELQGKSWEDDLHDESFIIKYPHDQQAHLSLHHDFCNITTLVNLNPGEFKGGGTYFPKYKCLVNPEEVGVMTLHPGSITHKHGARPVTEGTRYVVVSFIRSADHSAY